MGPGFVAGFCPAPLISSVPYSVPHGGCPGRVTGLRRPRGWLHLARPLSPAETTPPAPTSTAPLRERATTTAPGSHDRHRRRRHSGTRLHGAGSSSSSVPSSSTPPPPSSSLSPSASSSPPAALPTDKFPLPPPASAPALLTPEAFSGDGGAEWAGWECRFSGRDGTPVAVPEDYVPESLREWDVEVWGFETLTSEQRRRKQRQQRTEAEAENEDERSEGDRGDDHDLVYRKRGRVYPETGCALDNLTLEVNAQTSPLEGKGVFTASFPAGISTRQGGGHVLGKKSEGSPSLQLELGLLVPGVRFSDPSMAQPTADGHADDDATGAPGGDATDPEAEEEWSRVRVELRVDSEGGGRDGGAGVAEAALGPLVTVTRERRYRGGFDDGELYKGGGLDSQKLRRLLRSKCFAESESAPAPEALSGNWASGPGCWQLFHHDSAAAAQDKPSEDSTDPVTFRRPETSHPGIKTLLLRGGLTVRSGPWLDDDGGNSSAHERWGAAGSSMEKSSHGEGVFGEGDLWAVEVGWFVGAAGKRNVEGKDGGSREEEREVLTTVLYASSMVPLGVWKGAEKRVP
ncbi:unnamed protein product [Scytosiphon promiscuus]